MKHIGLRSLSIVGGHEEVCYNAQMNRWEKPVHETPWIPITERTTASEIWAAAAKKYEDTPGITNSERNYLVNSHAIALARRVLQLKNQSNRLTDTETAKFLGSDRSSISITRTALVHTVDFSAWRAMKFNQKVDAFRSALSHYAGQQKKPTLRQVAKILKIPHKICSTWLRHLKTLRPVIHDEFRSKLKFIGEKE